MGPVIIHCLFVSFNGQWLGGKPYRTGHHSLFICLLHRTVAGGKPYRTSHHSLFICLFQRTVAGGQAV